MNNEFSHLKKTNDALSAIENALENLTLAVEKKKNEIHNLKNCAAQSILQIDKLIDNINNICDQNGSGNNNN